MTRTQFLRFVVVGLLSNVLLYLGYLGLTLAGIEPKLAMTLLYITGVAVTFHFQRRWTFRDWGNRNQAFSRYCTSYTLGYVINLIALFVFVNRLGYPHEIVQGSMLLILALAQFLVQKFWIFRSTYTVPTGT